jgi:hypothetical protein
MQRHEAGEKPREDGAEHEELAVRDIDDAHDAEDERQAERGQRQHERADRALQEGQEEMGFEAQSGCLV